MIDAPHWRAADLPPIVEPCEKVRIVEECILIDDSTHPFPIRRYEISFVPDGWKGYAYNREAHNMVRYG